MQKQFSGDTPQTKPPRDSMSDITAYVIAAAVGVFIYFAYPTVFYLLTGKPLVELSLIGFIPYFIAGVTLGFMWSKDKRKLALCLIAPMFLLEILRLLIGFRLVSIILQMFISVLLLLIVRGGIALGARLSHRQPQTFPGGKANVK